MKNLTVFIVLILCSLSLAAQTVTVPFTTSNNLILITATVNKHEVTLLFDTGSVNTLVDAKATGIDVALTSMQHASYSRGAEGQIVEVPLTITLGSKKLVKTVFVGNLAELSEQLHVKINGILGQDIISHFHTITVNSKTHTITLEE